MSITKVNGTIEEQRGVNGRVKVISFKRDGVYINDSLEIKKEFPPEGFVFAPHFFNHFDYELNSLIEFQLSHIKSTKDHGDSYLLDFKVDPKIIGFPVFTIPENILIGEYSLNQSILNNYSEKFNSPHFYIKNKELLYGPFKNLNIEIFPKSGKEVCRWNSAEFPIYTSGENSYLLTPPSRNSDLIDCMTSAQLNTWLKDQIRNLKLDIDFNSLAKALESQQHVGLDIDRMKRVLTGIDQISLTHSELRYLASSSKRLEIMYSDSLAKLEMELKKELIEPIEMAKMEIETEILNLKKNRDKAQKEEVEYKSKIQFLKKEFESIHQEKDRLINDIRIHAIIGKTNITEFEKLLTYDEQIYELKENPYRDINEFILTQKNSLENDDSNNKFWYNSILQLKDYKCFLSDSVESILQIARLSNNCKVVLQQVEPDWLKFEYLFENGLKQIWKSAHENPDMIHFLILEDINMASIECYGRPLLDIVEGVRLKLPGLVLSMPDNLWVFGIPLTNKQPFEFGLPLIMTTFRKWGFFPKQQLEIDLSNKGISNKFLSVSNLYDHNIIVSISSNEYFPD